MRKYRQWDIYTVLMVAIVPVFLAVAWGLAWNHERVAAAQACENTATWLAEVSEAAPLFINAGSVGNADPWLNRMETIQPQGHGGKMHDSAVSAVEYASTVDPDLDTTEPGVISDAAPFFQDSIDEARATIVDECPDLGGMLPEALPMIFKENE